MLYGSFNSLYWISELEWVPRSSSHRTSFNSLYWIQSKTSETWTLNSCLSILCIGFAYFPACGGAVKNTSFNSLYWIHWTTTPLPGLLKTVRFQFFVLDSQLKVEKEADYALFPFNSLYWIPYLAECLSSCCNSAHFQFFVLDSRLWSLITADVDLYIFQFFVLDSGAM